MNKLLMIVFSLLIFVIAIELGFLFYPKKSSQNQTPNTLKSKSVRDTPEQASDKMFINFVKELKEGKVYSSTLINEITGTVFAIEHLTPSEVNGNHTEMMRIKHGEKDLFTTLYFKKEDIDTMTIAKMLDGKEVLVPYDTIKVGDIVFIQFTFDLKKEVFKRLQKTKIDIINK